MTTCDFICICICWLLVTTQRTPLHLVNLFALVVVNEPTYDSEVYLHLCVVDISIWTVCDVYCELSVMDVMFIWIWYVAVTEHNKLIICGSFAECNTRQRGLLPSTRVKTLGKVYTWQNSVHSGTKIASLPSVCAMTLGKEAKILCILGRVCRVPAIRHSAKDEGLLSFWNLTHGKGRIFAECLNIDTRQRRNLCRVSGIWHTTKEEFLPSAWTLTHGKGRSFAECLEHDTRQRKKLCWVPEIWHSANAP